MLNFFKKLFIGRAAYKEVIVKVSDFVNTLEELPLDPTSLVYKALQNNTENFFGLRTNSDIAPNVVEKFTPTHVDDIGSLFYNHTGLAVYIPKEFMENAS